MHRIGYIEILPTFHVSGYLVAQQAKRLQLENRIRELHLEQSLTDVTLQDEVAQHVTCVHHAGCDQMNGERILPALLQCTKPPQAGRNPRPRGETPNTKNRLPPLPQLTLRFVCTAYKHSLQTLSAQEAQTTRPPSACRPKPASAGKENLGKHCLATYCPQNTSWTAA